MILCIDLDGTLIHADMLYESALLLIKKNPLYIFLILFWFLIKGRAFAKHQIALRVQVSPETLPYNLELLDWLKIQKAQKKQGDELVLITATDQLIATQISDYLKIFDKTYGSNGKINLKAKAKRDFLDQTYGEKNYAYIGNSTADLPIWEHANSCGVVNASSKFIQHLNLSGKLLIHFPKPIFTLKNLFKTWLKALRVHQYAKNLLIFLPWILAHDFLNLPGFLSLVLGFICFSLLASSVYILNDLLDLTADRLHPRKSKRAFASGLISIPAGVLTAGICFLIAVIIACFLSWEFDLVMATYYILTFAYSFSLKSLALIDVYTLAVLYTLRIFAGMAILNSGYSNWLVLFSFFFFTSLAFIKRFTELLQASQQEKLMLPGRGYQIENLLLVKIFGVCSGFLSILIFGLYLNSFKASTLYHSPQILYALCPLLLYWISRIWLKASEGQVHDDPVVFALKDKVTYLLGAIVLVIAIMATL